MVKNGILHVHSTYSMHDSASMPEDIVKRAKELGCNNITLTDHGTLMGIDDFMDAGKKYGVNTIPGVEMYLEDKLHLILLAKDYDGFLAISKALKKANEQQMIAKQSKLVYPIMTKEILETLRGNEHIIVTSACVHGPIGFTLLENFRINKQKNKIEKKIEQLVESRDEYANAAESKKSIDESISKCKKERADFVKYTKDTYERQIQKKVEQKEKKEQELEEIDISDDTAKNYLKLIAKHDKLKAKIIALSSEINTMTELRRMGESIVAKVEKKLAKLDTQKKQVSEIMKKTKTKYNRCVEFEKEIEKIKLQDESKIYQKAKKIAKYFKELFPNFYLELQNHGLEQEKYVMPFLVRISKEENIPLIAANDAHMISGTADDVLARQILRYNYFKKHQEMDDADAQLYLKTDNELRVALSEVVDNEATEEAMNHLCILNECKVIFPDEKHYPKCKSEKSFLELLEEARQEKISLGLWNDTYEERLRHEIDVIEKMGYVDYHMIVRDFCIAGRVIGKTPKEELANMPVDFDDIKHWIKENHYDVGVGIGPGRGSAAGSLCCYLLGITNVDPIKYNLLFERYLNPERVSMPDIDTDVKTSIRQMIIRYIKQKYGKDAVSSIATLITYAPKESINMVTRDLADERYGKKNEEERKFFVSKILKVTDAMPEIGLKHLADWEDQFHKLFANDKDCVEVWRRAKLIEGRMKSSGVHAGGIVISDNTDVNEYVPLMWKEDNQVWATQCDMIRVEEKGMIKMDLLGLNMLDCISDCLYLIKKNKGISVNIDEIPFEEEVFKEIYATGKTNSVFQVESGGMKNMLREFEPTCFDDIILLLSMYRPGPMQFIPDVIAVKHKKKKLVYKTPLLEPILKDTYGAISYQEQVMQLFQVLAGYSLGQADLVRRAMSKKKEEKLKIERKAFVYGDQSRNIVGCVNNGISEQIANEIFDEVLEFAKYAFNRSHATAYAMVSYQTAWLKYHYPLEFICSMFNNKVQEKYGPLLEDCNTYGIQLLPPDINHSQYLFTIENNSIRYGFSGIKNIANEENVNKIIENRKQCHYTSFEDFVDRNMTENSLFDKSTMDALIKSGCFDDIEENRVALYHCYESINFKQTKESVLAGIVANKNLETNDKKIVREWEVEFLRYLLRENPLKKYQDDNYYGCMSINDLPEKGNAVIFGLLAECENKISKSGNPIILLNIQGKTGRITAFITGNRYEKLKNDIHTFENTVVRVKGSCSDHVIFVDTVEQLDAVKTSYSYTCDSVDKYELLDEELKNSAGLEELNIFSFYTRNTNGNIVKMKYPVVVKKNVTKAFLQKIRAVREK